MAGFFAPQVGDFVGIDYCKEFGYIIHDRGGHVGRWQVKLLDGNIRHCSTRDLRVITRKEMANQNCKYSTTVARANTLTTAEKLDLLLDHLGLRIENEPRVLKIEDDEEEVD